MHLPASLPRIPRALLAAAALLILLAVGNDSFAADETPLDDLGIVQRVESEGNSLIKSGRSVRLKTLRTQLAHAHTCTLTLPPAETEDLPASEIYARRSRGVLVVGVLARQKKRGRYEMAGCSGFALAADGVLVTNYHVVDNPDGDTLVVMTREGQVTPVSEVLAADKLSDVAILRAPGASFTPLTLAAEVPPTGSPVWVISHPDHNFFSFTAGVISRQFWANTEFGRTPQMAITADFGAGSSGGPILDRRGEVSGMVCSTTSVYWQDEKAKINDLQMVFKHCVPVGSIRNLIQPVKP